MTGLYVVSRVDESSLCKHVNERFIRGEQGDEQEEALSMLDEKEEAPQSHANLSQSTHLLLCATHSPRLRQAFFRRHRFRELLWSF
jgi:hypothetical protein